jgi:hypothetical protein
MPRERIQFLKAIDWDDPRSRDEVTKHYIGRIATLTFDKLHNPDEESAKDLHLHVSWGSPATSDDAPGGDFDKIKLVRPQLRIMVQNDFTPEDRAENPDLPPERYLLTYTPPTEEATPSKTTLAFMHELRSSIQQDLGVNLDEPAKHELTAKPDIDLMDAPDVQLVGRNMYSGEGASMDIFLPAEEAAKGYRTIISKGEKEMGPKHIPSWLDFADDHKNHKNDGSTMNVAG